MKRSLSVFLIFVTAITLLVGCHAVPADSSPTSAASSALPSPSAPPSTATPDASTATPSLSSDASTVSSDITQMLDVLEHKTDSEDAPVVYMTTDISPEGLIAVYEALGRTPTGKVAVKLHTGEGENSYYLRPDFIKELVQTVEGTIVECNTAYGGSRASTALHMQVAEDRGFTAIAPVDIMDADGGVEIPVTDGTQLTTNQVGAHFMDYDFFIILSHFKGHQMGGFGGALKNMSIGIASSEGKSLIHTGGKSTKGYGPLTPVDTFTESMAEAAKSVSDYLDDGSKILYINVMNNLSIDCDCNAYPKKPDMHDIGILASLDPVALDQACVDFVYASPDGKSVIQRIESRNGVHVLEHAEEIGLGSREYRLEVIDD